MEVDFVTFEIAKKLKEKGFKEKCITYYWEKINEHTPDFVIEDTMPEDGICITDLLSEHNKAKWSPFIDAPTIAQALKWLRDTYKLFLSPCVIADFYPDITYWSFEVVNIESGDYVYREYEHIDDKRFSSYEEATLAGIEYVLDNLI
jgi:hypothetical protein